MHPKNGISQDEQKTWRICYPETGEDWVGFSKKLPGWIRGYLQEEILVKAEHVVPPPPEEHSTERRFELAYSQFIQAVTPDSRRLMAEQDADLSWASLGRCFSDAADTLISRTATPALHKVMNRLLTDAAIAVCAIKCRHPRARPDPRQPPDSWPSGHATAGMLWAMMLTRVFPERATMLQRRAFEFGYSRMVCQAHWYSDVIAGYHLACYLHWHLQHDLRYQDQLTAAIRERHLTER